MQRISRDSVGLPCQAYALARPALVFLHRPGTLARLSTVSVLLLESSVALQRIDIEKRFPFSVEKLFAHLSEHEHLAELFKPAKVSRLRNGDHDRNGVGSVRKLRVGPGPSFEETVTAFEENRLIEYRITRGSPLRNHFGRMQFAADGDGSRLHYTIEFEGKVPGLAAIIRPVLEQGIRRGLDKLHL